MGENGDTWCMSENQKSFHSFLYKQLKGFYISLFVKQSMLSPKCLNGQKLTWFKANILEFFFLLFQNVEQ